MSNSNQAPLKRAIFGFLKKIFDALVEHIIGIIVVGIIGIVVLLFWLTTDLVINLWNIPKEEALAAARARIGPDIVDAIPFRNRFDQKQYIAVLAQPSSLDHLGSVFLFQGRNESYQTKDLEFQIASPLPESPEDVFGVLDIDKDGKKEIFLTTGASGSGGYSIVVQVYSTGDEQLYSGSAFGDYGHMPQFELPAGNEKVKDWILKRLDIQVADFHQDLDMVEELTWEKNNGRGFFDGNLKLYEVKGRLVSPGAVMCQMDNGPLEWTSFWRGPVYEYDRERDVHYVIYAPETWYFGYVSNMILGKGYLWFSIIKRNGLVVYDFRVKSLAVIPVEGLENGIQTDVSRLENSPGFLELRSGSLVYIDDIQGIEMVLTLPPNIDYRVEFANPTGCSNEKLTP